MSKYIKNIGSEEYQKSRTPEKLVEKEFEHIQETKKATRFSINRWTLISITAAIAIVLLIFTVSVVTVNSSLNEIQNLQKELGEIKQKNEILKREINYLESPERITIIAKDKLGLVQSKDAPQFLDNIETNENNKDNNISDNQNPKDTKSDNE